MSKSTLIPIKSSTSAWVVAYKTRPNTVPLKSNLRSQQVVGRGWPLQINFSRSSPLTPSPKVAAQLAGAAEMFEIWPPGPFHSSCKEDYSLFLVTHPWVSMQSTTACDVPGAPGNNSGLSLRSEQGRAALYPSSRLYLLSVPGLSLEARISQSTTPCSPASNFSGRFIKIQIPGLPHKTCRIRQFFVC
jgi:hypothetical protein